MIFGQKESFFQKVKGNIVCVIVVQIPNDRLHRVGSDIGRREDSRLMYQIEDFDEQGGKDRGVAG